MYKIMIADDEGIVIDALKFIIELIFFKELGYSYEEINEITSKNNRFKLNQYYTL